MKELFKQEYLFWFLQFASWNLFFGFLDIIIQDKYDFSLKYEISGYISTFLVFFLSTSIFRWFIKRYIFGQLEIRSIFKILLGIILTIFVSMALDKFFEFFVEDVLSIPNEHKLMEGDSYERDLVNEAIVFLLFISCWTFGYLISKLSIKANKDRIERLELTNELKEAQLNTLKGQINPHFMFNSLNNIRGLMLEDVHRSREMITKLSDMLRYSLTKNGNDAILLAEELEMVDNYIELSKIQMEDRLQFEKYIDKDLENISVPPMLLQLLVENAAKHGIANQKNGGIIKLTVTKEAEDLLLEVTNTGSLNIAKNSTQLGLKNIKERLRLLYGENATFSLSEWNNEVVARIKIINFESFS